MYKNIMLTLMLATLIIGCGGGSGSKSDDNDNSVGTGYYIDSPVKGVHYMCGNQSGTTGEDGSFKFEKGQLCTFTIGEILLRTVEPEYLIDDAKILEDNIDTAQLLQTLDNDGNATNGIVVLPAVVQALIDANITQLPTTDTDALSIYDVIKNVSGYSGRAKTQVETQEHLEVSLSPIVENIFKSKIFYLAFGDVEIDEDDTVFFMTLLNYDQNLVVNNSFPLKAMIETNGTLQNISEQDIEDGFTTTSTQWVVKGTKIYFRDEDGLSSNYIQYLGTTSKGVVIKEDDLKVKLYFQRSDAEAYFNRIVNEWDNSVLDRNEALQWQDSTDNLANDLTLQRNNSKSWDDAKMYCESLEYSGQNDWRVPTITEIRTTVDMTQDLRVKSNFSNVAQGGYPNPYWVSDSNSSPYIAFSYGVGDSDYDPLSMNLSISDGSGAYVRCVRTLQ